MELRSCLFDTEQVGEVHWDDMHFLISCSILELLEGGSSLFKGANTQIHGRIFCEKPLCCFITNSQFPPVTNATLPVRSGRLSGLHFGLHGSISRDARRIEAFEPILDVVDHCRSVDVLQGR